MRDRRFLLFARSSRWTDENRMRFRSDMRRLAVGRIFGSSEPHDTTSLRRALVSGQCQSSRSKARTPLISMPKTGS
eukprot:1469084-Ditylum_brightwellii.AAC.1